MSDLITRQSAIDALEKEKSLVERPITETRWFDLGLGKAQDVLSDLPSAQPERCEDCVNFSKNTVADTTAKKHGRGHLEMKIENVSVAGFQPAIRGMRNPYDSWDKSDSEFCDIKECGYAIGGADLKLMQDLAKAGAEHRKYARMIVVWMDITAPRYWWHEFDTYKIGTVANSCSTMHKLTSKPITLDDFETDEGSGFLRSAVANCEHLRQRYLQTNDEKYWRKLIQLLPQSYLQKRTVMLNYEICCNIYTQRKGHKLKEWEVLCKAIEDLPYFKEIFDE